MILLGFDTATPSTAVALAMPGGEIREARDDPRAEQRPRHTSDLLTLAVELIGAAGVGWRDLDAIAVGLGPGTFTGLRVGVATARGLAQSLDVSLLAVPSLAALAEPALAQRAGSPVLAVLDARRGEAFLAAYLRQGGTTSELLAPRALQPEQLAAALAALTGGGGDGAPVAIGDGALRFRAELQAAGATVPKDSSPLHLLRASAVCEIALREGSAQDLDRVLPRYGRRPDAEMAIEAGKR